MTQLQAGLTAARPAACCPASAGCADGYGAAAPLLGPCSPCTGGTYGPAGRSGTACTPCYANRVFTWPGGSESFAPATISLPGSTSLDHCLADFAAPMDGPMDIAGQQLVKYASIRSLSGCVDECRSGTLASICVAVQFDSATSTCALWQPLPSADWSTGG